MFIKYDKPEILGFVFLNFAAGITLNFYFICLSNEFANCLNKIMSNINLINICC